MNPYSPPPDGQPDELDPAFARKARQTATALASGGAAVGSITKKLQAQGLKLPMASSFAKDAVAAQSRTVRFAGLCLVAAGIVLLAIGGFLFAIGYGVSHPFSRRIPTFVAMAGGFPLLLGLFKLFHRSPLDHSKANRNRMK